MGRFPKLAGSNRMFDMPLLVPRCGMTLQCHEQQQIAAFYVANSLEQSHLGLLLGSVPPNRMLVRFPAIWSSHTTLIASKVPIRIRQIRKRHFSVS